MNIKIAMCLNVLKTSDNLKPNIDFCETMAQFPFYINNIKKSELTLVTFYIA